MKQSSSNSSGFSILKFLLGTFVLFLLAIFVFLTFFLSPTAKWAANTQVPELLGTATSVEDVKIDLWSGDIELIGVRVANPGSKADAPALFSLGRLYIDIDTSSVFSDTLLIREITLESPEVHTTRDQNGKFSFEELKIMQPSEEAPKEPEEESEEGEFPRGIRIEKISVTNLAGSFKDSSDPKAINSYAIKNFNFNSEEVTVNPGDIVTDLPKGVQFAILKLSDAVIDYSTNKDILDPNAPLASTESTKKKKTKAKSSPGQPGTTSLSKSKGKSKSSKTSTSTAEPAAVQEPAPVEESTTADKMAAEPLSEAITSTGSGNTETEGKTDPLYIGQFVLENFSVHYIDTPKKDKKNKKKAPLDIKLIEIFVNADDIGFDPSGLLETSADKVLTAKLGFKIPQEHEKSKTAIFSGVAKSTLIGSGLPVTAGAVQLTGFELATVKPLVPSGLQTAIGGPAFDLYAKWFVSPDKLDGFAKITSNKNVVTNVTLKGTPQKPILSGSELLMNVIGRPGQMLGNLAGNTFKGGLDIVSGATGAAGDLAKGAGDTVLGFGKGLLNTGKGLMKGNLKEAGKGLEEATVGTVKTASSAVGKSAGTAVGGVGNAYNSTTGNTRSDSWRESNSSRHEEFQHGANEWLVNDKFPPDTATAPNTTKKKTKPAAATTSEPAAPEQGTSTEAPAPAAESTASPENSQAE
tara:strand:+ start:48255 stop:50333 length:2079 start_codon:yes stop_codon:yes gene_type:complete